MSTHHNIKFEIRKFPLFFLKNISTWVFLSFFSVSTNGYPNSYMLNNNHILDTVTNKRIFTVPSVTVSVGSITFYSALLDGQITSNLENITEVGFVYSETDATPTIGESGVLTVRLNSGSNLGLGTSLVGPFRANIAPLDISKLYYCRAYAINSSGVGYSSIETFTTSDLSSQKLGNTVEGNRDDNLGTSIAISKDGERIVVGASGFVKIYELSGGDWVQLGNDLSVSSEDNFGFSTDIDSDGDRIIIGSPSADANGNNSGKVYVYEYDGNNWILLGSSFSGTAAEDQVGYSVSINNDGSKIIYGAIGASNKGSVSVFEYNANNWGQLGTTILGEATDDKFGSAVDINGIGNKIVVGAPLNDGNGSNAGHARVYEYSSNQWAQLGSDIEGDSNQDQSGYSVSIDSTGTIIAIGSPYYDGNSGNDSGSVRVYEYLNSIWQQKGNTLEGDDANNEFGSQLKLSEDGTKLIIGSPKRNADDGKSIVYKYKNTNWNPYPSTLITGDSDSNLGHSIDISGDGLTFVVGAPSYNSNRAKGYFEVYTIESDVTLPAVNMMLSSQALTLEADILYTGDSDVTERGILYTTGGNLPEIGGSNVTQITLGQGTGIFTTPILYSLSHSTTYLVRAYVINAEGTTYSAHSFYTVENEAVINTSNPSDITANSAILGGQIVNDYGDPAIERGILYSSTNTNPSIEDNDIIKKTITTTNNTFSETISNLEENTTYYVKAYMVSYSGVSYGSVSSFTTFRTPELTASVPTIISGNSAVFVGEVIDSGGNPIIGSGFVYSDTDTNPTYNAPNVVTISNSFVTVIGTPFYNTIQSLSPNTTYYVRTILLTNNQTLYYSDPISFTTDPVVVDVSAATSITQNSADIEATISDNGGNSITERGIVYSSLETVPEIGDTGVTVVQDSQTGNGTYTNTITNLTPLTEYYYRAYVVNSLGTFYSVPSQFQTKGPVVVITSDATSITSNSATLGGTITDTGNNTIIEQGIVYSTSNNDPEIDASGVIKVVNTDWPVTTYSNTISSLPAGTLYYMKAYTITFEGSTYYGTTKQFRTSNGALGVETHEVQAIDYSSVTLMGAITNEDDGTITERGFLYSITNSNPKTGDADVIKISTSLETGSSQLGSYNSFVDQLSRDHTYHVRAYAKNANGITHADVILSFSTLIITGNTIEGKDNHKYFGSSLNYSKDGSILAIGASGSLDDVSIPPQVTDRQEFTEVYQNVSGTWVQLGNKIDSLSIVSLNADGTKLAAGAFTLSHDNYNNTKKVKVYEYDGSDWIQFGQTITSTENGFGISVSLNAEGNILAIASENSIVVEIYKYNSATNLWEQMGTDINLGSAATRTMLPPILSLDDSGTVLAVGAPDNDTSNGIDSGEVRIYRYNGSNWIQEHQFKGEAESDQFGTSTQLSSDGNTLVVSTGPYKPSLDLEEMHSIYVYEYSGNTWNPLGNPITTPDNDKTHYFFGTTVSIDSTGKRLATSSKFNDATFDTNNITIHIYDYRNGIWSKVIEKSVLSELRADINISNSIIDTYPVAISDDANSVAFSDIHSHNLGGHFNNGIVHTFSLPNKPSVINPNENATNTSFSTIDVSGEITSFNGSPITESGFVYSTTNINPEIGENDVLILQNIVGLGEFNSTLTGLSPNTTYYYRAYAMNDFGTTYSEVIQATTRQEIDINFSLNETKTNITSMGVDMLNDFGDPITSKGILYSTTNTNPELGAAGIIQVEKGPEAVNFSDEYELDLNTTYYSRAYATNNGGTIYSDVETFTTYDGIITFDNRNTAGLEQFSWSNPSNWDHNRVPTYYDHIKINFETAPTGSFMDISDLTVNKVSIEDNSSFFRITNGNSLTISESLENHGTLNMLSEASLTVNGSLNNQGDITLNHGSSLIVEGNITQSPATKVSYLRSLDTKDWYMVSPPFQGETIENFISNNTPNLATGNGFVGLIIFNNNEYGYEGNGWVFQNPLSTGPMNPGTAYAVQLKNSGNIIFEGSLFNSDVSMGAGTGTQNAYNLIGNPYTSYIASNSGANSSNNLLDNNGDDLEEKTIWIWDGDVYYAVNHASDSRFIAPGQGFFVTSKEGGQAFQFKKDMQSHQNALYDRSSSDNTNTKITLKISDEVLSRQTDIYYLENASTSFDNGYDSTFFGDNSFLAIYTRQVDGSTEKNYMIQSLPKNDLENLVVPLEIINPTPNNNLSFNVELNNFPNHINIYLEDRKTETFTKLDESNLAYNIPISENFNGVGRFYLHTTSQILSNHDLNPTTVSRVYVYENLLKIEGIYQENVTIQLFNILGKQIYSTVKTLTGKNEMTLPTNLKTGTYIAQLYNANIRLNKKVFIQK